MRYQDKGEIRMPYQCNALKYSLRLLVWIAIIACWPTAGALAADAGHAIRQITPMREMVNHQLDVRAVNHFDIVGTLNLIESDRMTIGDRELKIAPGVDTSRARQWNLVGAKLNQAGEILVLETISDEPN
jgi:hypothetical protein